MDPHIRSEIAAYAALDEDDFYSILGAYSSPGTEFSPTGQIKKGKSYFDSIHDRLQQTICHEWDLCTKIADPRWDDGVQLVAALGDVVAAVTVGVPPLLIASLVVKIGVRSFCACSDQ